MYDPTGNHPIVPYVSLCSGYEGIGLGLHRCIPNLRTVAYCEREIFGAANLCAKIEAGLLDPAPIFTDVCTFPWSEFAPFMAGGILSFGWPCQPVSHAGKRKATEDERWLFDIIADGIGVMRPGLLFAENVEGLLSARMPDGSSVFGHCITRLERLHYKVAAGIFGASECGAPHQRKRVFILAERSGERGAATLSRQISRHEGIAGVADNCGDQAWPSRPGEQQFAWEPPRVVVDDAARLRSREPAHGCGQAASGADASGEVLANAQATGGRPVAGCVEEASSGEQAEWQLGRTFRCDTEYSDSAMGNAAHTNRRSRVSAEEAGVGPEDIWRRRSGESGERQTQPPLGRDADGPADWLDHAELFTTCDNRTDELRLLGNGVVPACAERAFRTLVSELVGYSESQ